MAATTSPRNRFRRSAGFLVLAAVACAPYPRLADLRAFDPAAMAQAETLMWRHYCENRARLKESGDGHG